MEENVEEDKAASKLFKAVEANDVHAVESLLEGGADIRVCDRNGDTLLHTAARLGHSNLCSFLIKNGAETNAPNKAAFTPLFLAARVSLQTVQVLIQFGGDVELCNHLGEIPLHAASSSGLVDVIFQLISSGCDVNARSAQGLTPLYLAIGSGSRRAVEALLRFGADVNQVFEPEPFSRAKSASAESHIQSCKDVCVCFPRQNVWLSRRPDSGRPTFGDVVREPEERDFNRSLNGSDRTSTSHSSEEQWQHKCGLFRPYLQASGLSLSPQTPFLQERNQHQHQRRLDLDQQRKSLFPRPPSFLSVNTVKPSRDTDNIVTKLPPKVSQNCQQPYLQNQRQIRAENSSNSDSQPCFSTCPVQLRRKKREFLDKGNELYSNSASCILDTAADLNNRLCPNLQVSYGSAVHPSKGMQALENHDQANATKQTAAQGVTPLHRASQLGMESVAKVLLEAGANVDSRTKKGETPLHFAAKYSSTLGHGEVTGLLRLLIASGADIEAATSTGETALHLASLVGDALSASILISSGADVNKRDDQGDFPLHLLCKRIVAPEANRVRTVRLLLTNGASANVVNCGGHSPLHILLLHKDDDIDLDIVRVLLSYKADPNQRTPCGQHPLLLALNNRLFDLAKVLVEKGADPNVAADDGKTPLHYVCKAGHTQLFKAVWAKGGNPTALDARGFSPLRYAVESGLDAMVRVCLNTGAPSWQTAAVTDRFSLGSNTNPSLSDIRDSSSGVSSPFLYAFSNAQHVILSALFTSGCFTFAELHKLRTLCQELDKDELSACQCSVVRFVLDASQAPPSLQLFCRWKISHLIGFRADRKLRARQLGLPTMLRDFVLFVNGA